MRFILFDRVLTLEKGSSILGRTAFGRSPMVFANEGQKTVVPTSMLIEAMVQLLGWAVIHDHDFQLAAIVCLVEGVTVRQPFLDPGIAVEVGGEILSNGREDSLGRTWIDIDGARHATIDRVIYRHFHDVDPDALEREFRQRAGGFTKIQTTGPSADRLKKSPCSRGTSNDQPRGV